LEKEKTSELVRVHITVPAEYLKKFDTIIQGFYSTRNEAIRQGMTNVLKDIQSLKKAAK
jgi:metal-responsive CopG/Arc/MetJ family transcriptional regulator